MNLKLIYPITIGILLLIILFLSKCNKKEVQTVTIYDHLGDSTTFFKNKNNEQVAKNSVLQSDNLSYFTIIKSKDLVILDLQKRVIEYKDKLKNSGSVTNFNTGTSITNTTVTIIHDTLPVNDSSKCNNIYISTYEDEWIKYNIKASKDSIKLDLQTIDKYSVILGEEGKVFHKKNIFVEVVSSSPYTNIKSVKAYQVTNNLNKPKFCLGIQGGYGITTKGLSPYIGIGCSYNFISIK